MVLYPPLYNISLHSLLIPVNHGPPTPVYLLLYITPFYNTYTQCHQVQEKLCCKCTLYMWFIWSEAELQPHTYEPDPHKGSSKGCSDGSLATRQETRCAHDSIPKYPQEGRRGELDKPKRVVQR